MGEATQEHLDVSGEECALLVELLKSEQDRLLVEIRHTDHRSYRDELRHRLDLVERALQRCHQRA